MASKYLVALALAACFILPVAIATVTFDPLTATGFVGKGDVQLAFGWNNADLQAKAAGVSFMYEVTSKVEATCEWTTGPVRNRRVHTVDKKVTTTVNSAITYEARKQSGGMGYITGFNLKGLGASTTTVSGGGYGALPVVGDVCLGEGVNGLITMVVDVEGSMQEGLFVSYNGNEQQLVWPVPLVAP